MIWRLSADRMSSAVLMLPAFSSSRRPSTMVSAVLGPKSAVCDSEG
jgi:hypothetical protein